MNTSVPSSYASYLDYGVTGILLVAIIVLFKIFIKERNKNEKLQIAHKEEMKALLYELVADARERSSEYLQVADRVTSVLESLERRATKTDRRR